MDRPIPPTGPILELGQGQSPLSSQRAARQASSVLRRKAAGPTLKPGTTASDYKWSDEAGQWVFNGHARPGMVYIPRPDMSKTGQTGWQPEKNIAGGWTKAQILAIAGIGAAAAAGPIISAFSGAGAGAGGAAASAGGAAGAGGAAATVPAIPVTAGLGGLGGAATTVGGAGGAASILGSAAKTKGTVGTILDVVGKVSPILTGAAGARADARDRENELKLRRDQMAQNAAIAAQNAKLAAAGIDLQRREFALGAPGKRLSTGVRGSYVANAHNVGVGTGDPITLSSGRVINPIKFTGLGADDLLSPEARALGQRVTEDELRAQMEGDKFDPIPDIDIPGASKPDEGGVGDSVLGAAGIGSAVAGAFSPAIKAIIDRATKKKVAIPDVDTTIDSMGGL